MNHQWVIEFGQDFDDENDCLAFDGSIGMKCLSCGLDYLDAVEIGLERGIEDFARLLYNTRCDSNATGNAV